jgi:hypothetical protein
MSDDTPLSDHLPDEEVLYAKVQFPWEISMVHPGAGAGTKEELVVAKFENQ